MTLLSPTSATQVVIDIDGHELAQAGARALSSIVVEQGLAMPTQCEVVFDGLALAELSAALQPGTPLRLGLVGDDTRLFSGDVTVVEHIHAPDGERQLRVRAYDRLHRLRKRQTVRAFVDLDPAELARELVADTGLNVVAHGDLPRWDRIVQARQSDLRLLIEVTERSGLYPSVRDDELHLLTLAGSGDVVPLRLGVDLFETQLELSGEPAVRRVRATGWASGSAEPFDVVSTAAEIGRAVDIAVDPTSVGGDGVRQLIDAGAPSEDRARALAQAELDRAVTNEVILRGVAAGNPRLRPGARIDVRGLDAAYQGSYVIVTARHTLDAERGYLVELSTEAPEPRIEPPQATRTLLGRVLSVADPDRRGRVQVALATHHDIESSWLQVLAPGAGANKGFVALPDVEDRVLVLLPDGDPAQGVVLGGLYGSEGPYDSGVEGPGVRRYSVRTRSGQVVRMDDEAGELRLEDASGGVVVLSDQHIRVASATGNEIELGPDRLLIHSATDLVIEAPGKDIKIRGASIDFESA